MLVYQRVAPILTEKTMMFPLGLPYLGGVSNPESLRIPSLGGAEKK